MFVDSNSVCACWQLGLCLLGRQVGCCHSCCRQKLGITNSSLGQCVILLQIACSAVAVVCSMKLLSKVATTVVQQVSYMCVFITCVCVCLYGDLRCSCGAHALSVHMGFFLNLPARLLVFNTSTSTLYSVNWATQTPASAPLPCMPALQKSVQN